ncbi:hemerythrin domain-containing protein [Saccharopolyspora shandongensis]|uniref:hemerythrin domain-containing protein n=1 Tax=Saccharopolyspora shandongensis TaxID=418495 RepID=UPI003434D9F0
MDKTGTLTAGHPTVVDVIAAPAVDAKEVLRLAASLDQASPHRARGIAVQSAAVGMALSIIAMGVATVGWLPPAAGALLQEGIDVTVILNALRALRGSQRGELAVPHSTENLLQRFASEQEKLRETLHLIRDTADLVSEAPGSTKALVALRQTSTFLDQRLVPHERAEETQLYPAIAAALGGSEATATMSRMHAEIDRLSRRIGAHLQLAESHGRIEDDQIGDLLATLYGLHAVLRLHFTQEEESYFALADTDRDS